MCSFHPIHLTLNGVALLVLAYPPVLHRCSVQRPVSRFASHYWHA